MTNPPQPVPAARRARVDAARETWIRRLIDTSRRNNLLFFRDLKLGTLDLSFLPASAAQDLIAGRSLKLREHFSDETWAATRGRLVQIHRTATANDEEKGLQTLYVAFGKATWPASDQGSPASAAVFLVPVKVDLGGTSRADSALVLAGDIKANLALLHVLREEFHQEIQESSLLAPERPDDDPEAEARLDPLRVLSRLETLTGRIPGFSVSHRIVLGNFAFQKLAMVQDLQQLAGPLAEHNIVAAITGDAEARSSLGRDTNQSSRDLDNRQPDEEFYVLDADSSQQAALVAAERGSTLVIQGPPGTGKSQTIANLIAAQVAIGKRVLFVAEKRAALEAVQKRLVRVGLGPIALDLHGADISRREVMRRVKETFEFVRGAPPAEAEAIHRRYVDRRGELNAHVGRLHASRSPIGDSMFALQGRLLRCPADARSLIRWHGADLAAFTPDQISANISALEDLATQAQLVLRTSPSPWCGARCDVSSQAEAGLKAATALAHDAFPRFVASLDVLLSGLGLRQPETIAQAAVLVDVLSGIASTLAAFDPRLYDADLPAHATSLAPAARGALSALWHFCTSKAYRASRRRLNELRRGGRRVGTRELLAAVTAAHHQRTIWRKYSAAPIALRAADGIVALQEACQVVIEHIKTLDALVPSPLGGMPLLGVGQSLTALAADRDTPFRIPPVRQREQEIERSGLGPLLSHFRSVQLDVRFWVQAFEFALWSSALERIRAEEPMLATFDGSRQGSKVREFAEADRERIRLAALRVRRAHAVGATAAENAFPDQAALLRREAQKRKMHRPLRELIDETQDVFTALCPCVMASPLSVSQLLPGATPLWDLCIFDEASQVLPEDAVTSLLRARQAVVAGDTHQLPPTTFFADTGGGDDEVPDVPGADATAGLESILDVFAAFGNQRMLNWHYRSRDERLIAFSNDQIYHNRLITFPSSNVEGNVRLELVQPASFRDGEEDSASAEVLRVAALVVEHAVRRPTESLGVIAMGIKHANRLQAAIDAAAALKPELEAFLGEHQEERLFVKNLERVQGDERDAIILSIGYGKDRSGNLPYRFGPLLQQGGQRRLNVAITRARTRMTVVSSFSAQDMDPARSKAPGVEMLRAFLEYAASRGSSLGDGRRTTTELNDFEADVFDALAAQGLSLEPQWGTSVYRIDMAAKHPRKPGRFVLAIECDGATYHSTPIARERDRLRQEHLEALGWRFHRIWSTDWFTRRDAEIARALKAFEMAVRRADEADANAPSGVGSAATGRQLDAGIPEPRARSGRRPLARTGAKIDDYSSSELSDLFKWLQSDGLLRPDDQLIREACDALGFQRLGARIEESLWAALARSRRS